MLLKIILNEYAGFTTHSATSRQGENGQFSHLGSTSIIAFTHVSPQCRHIAAKHSARIVRATRTFWSLLCGCFAHNSAYQGARFECIRSLICSDIQAYTKYSNAVYWIEICWLSHHAMRKWASPSLSLVGRCYKLWIPRIMNNVLAQQVIVIIYHVYGLIIKIHESENEW